MKTIKRLFALIMVVVLLAGCTMKTDYGFNISSDKKVKLEYTIAYDKEFLEGMLSMENMGEENAEPKEYTDDELWAALDEMLKEDETATEEGVTKTKYTKDGWYGYVISKELGNIDDLAKEATERNNILGDDFLDKPIFVKDGEKYKSNITIKDEDGSMAQMSQAESSGAVFELTLTVKLPSKAISNNASTVSEDGKELTWKLTEPKDVDFEFEFVTEKAEEKKDKKETSSATSSSSSNLILYVGIGAGVLVLLVVIIAIISSSKKKKVAAAEPVQPAVMSPTYGPTVQPLEPPVQPVQPVQQPAQPVAEPVQPAEPAEPAQPVEPQDPNNTQM